MINQVILVGRIVEKNNDNIVINNKRPYKSENGEYESDNIKIRLGNSLSANVNEYCEIGSLAGVKGRIQVINDEIVIIAEKITFLGGQNGRTSNNR